MDHSEVTQHEEQGKGEEEVLSSNESGWTKYFVSPHQSADEEESNISSERNMDEDYDSMASDASSGPSYTKSPVNISRSNGNTMVKKEDGGDIVGCSTWSCSKPKMVLKAKEMERGSRRRDSSSCKDGGGRKEMRIRKSSLSKS